MAYPTVEPEVWEAMKRKLTGNTIKTVPQTVVSAVKVIAEKTGGAFDSLVLLVIALLYFFFTGIALVLGRQLPKEWLAISTALDHGRVSNKIKREQQKANKVEQKPTKVRGVDLETQRDISPAA
mgnify:FL=1